MKLIASGTLVIVVAPERTDTVVTAIKADVPAAVIGVVRPASEGVTIVTNGTIEPLTLPARGEIARKLEDN